MNLSEAAIRRPVATILLSLALVLVGLAGYRLLPVAALPTVDFPTIAISASLPGANPQTMASAVATPIERQLSTIAGIDNVTSVSTTGSTQITVQFALDRDIDGAALDVQSALSAVQRRLPVEMLTPPSFQKVNPADLPIAILALEDPTRPLPELQKLADLLVVPRISTLEGVSQVNSFGSRKAAVRVRFDPRALAARDLTAADLQVALAQANSNSPVGTVANGERAFILDATGVMRTASDFADVTVAWRDGAAVKVRDVASVVDSVENERAGAELDGRPVLMFGVSRQPGANVVATVDRVRAMLPKLSESLPGSAKLTLVLDRSASVRDSARDAQFTLALTALLVVGVIFLVLGDWRATLIPAVVLPVAGIATFAAMYALGYSLDNLSLLALTLATGFVVDDAIVVLENIVRHVEEGMAPFAAAIRGASEIGFTVVSISVSLVAVFIPLLFMGGIVGRLFHEFAMTMTVAIAISALVSLTLTPMMAARLLRPGRHAPAGIAAATTRAFERLEASYARGLERVLARGRLVIALTILSIAVAALGFYLVPKGFFPVEDTGTVFVGTEAAPDASYATILMKQRQVAAALRRDPAVSHVVSIIGTSSTLNTGRMFAPLKERSERDGADTIQKRLRRALNFVPGMAAYPNIPQNLSIGGRPGASLYQYTLTGPDGAAVRAYAGRLEAALRGTAGFEDVTSDDARGGRGARVTIDRDAAGRLGVPVAAVRDALYSAYGVRQVSTIYTDTDSFQVILEADPARQIDPSSIGDLFVRGGGGALVPLTAVTRVEVGPSALTVSHQQQLPAVTLGFNLTPGVALSKAQADIAAANAELAMPEGVSGSFQGNAQAFEASTKGQVWLFLAAIAVIYVVLGVLYESFAHPVTILAGLPAAGIGAVAALALTGHDLDVIGVIGVVLLIGIVKKNAIMMIDFAVAARAQGMPAPQAIRDAAIKRFRPIAITSFAAFAGALPIALGLGAGAELRQPLGIAVAGGLLVSQALTLFITPVIYLAIDGLSERWRARRAARALPAAAE